MIHHHPTITPSPIVNSISQNLNKFDLFKDEPKPNFKGATKISSTLTKMCSLLLVGMIVVIIGMSVIVFRKNAVVRDYEAVKMGGMEERLAEEF